MRIIRRLINATRNDESPALLLTGVCVGTLWLVGMWIVFPGMVWAPLHVVEHAVMSIVSAL